jgi:hypothetical protein
MKLEPRQRKGNEMASNSSASGGARMAAQDVQRYAGTVYFRMALSYSLTGTVYHVVDLTTIAFQAGISE